MEVSLHLPYQDNLSALIHEPSFKAAAGETIFSETRVINQLGNQAVDAQREPDRVREPDRRPSH